MKAARFVHHRYTDTRLCIVSGRDSNPNSVTDEQIAVWQRDSRVEFLGHIASPWSESAASHVFVLAATAHDGLTRTLLEAMAVVRAIINRNLSGWREVVRDANGVLFKPGDCRNLQLR